jgi:hypothetical protein
MWFNCLYDAYYACCSFHAIEMDDGVELVQEDV